MDNQEKLCPSVGRAEKKRIVNVHGDNKKVEEATKQFNTRTKASVWSCFIVVKDIVLQKLYYILKMYTMLD